MRQGTSVIMMLCAEGAHFLSLTQDWKWRLQGQGLEHLHLLGDVRLSNHL